ncbi:MAG: GGDEF domain-containing protein, partial [Candidatus Tectomicrobia bacterium]|nr:GGDEF domain-containing protein [Candidatus Tectomicrobia bacterium]
KALARTDSLTGVINRRYFFELAQRENSRAHRHKQPFTVMFIDLDNFKDVNDVSGHMTGDALLRLVGETMRKNLRQTDIIARLGGDEFAVLLPETGPEPSVHIVMRKLQENLLQVMEKNGWPVTFSIGAVTFLRPPSSVDEMIRLPDDLMYSVKGKGKNMIKYAVFDG